MRRHHHRAGGGEKQRVAIGIGFGDVAAAQRAVGAGLVVDIDALAEQRRHLVGHQAADEVGRAAGREGDDDADRPGRKILRLRNLRSAQRQRGADGRQHTVNLAHVFLPLSGVVIADF